MELEELRKLEELRIEGETKQELVQKICSLYGWTKKENNTILLRVFKL